MAASRKKIAEFLGNSSKTVENWEKENRYIIQFIRKYLNDDVLLDEFMQTGSISYLENSKMTESRMFWCEDTIKDQAFYTLKPKLQGYTISPIKGGGFNRKKVLIEALDAINKNGIGRVEVNNAKSILVATINSIEVYLVGIVPTPEVSNKVAEWVENNLSNIEAYILIHDYKRIFELIKKDSKV